MAQIDELLAPGYLEGLEGWDFAEVRAQRERAEVVEIGMSYLRRIVQGRLDIVRSELARRQRGDPGSLSELVERLPAILSDNVHAPGTGRLPALMSPGTLEPSLVEQLESILPVTRMPELPGLGDEEIAVAVGGLERLERSTSDRRRALHKVIDRLEEEIVRRYQTGEASVDSLLQ